MTLKALLLLAIVVLIVRAVRKAMRPPSPKLAAAPASKRVPPYPPPASRAARSSAPPPASKPPPAAKSTSGAEAAGASPSHEIPEERAPHEVLGVPVGATADELRAAYQRLAREYHPDRVEGLAPELKELAHRRMVEINRAYDRLTREGAAD